MISLDDLMAVQINCNEIRGGTKENYIDLTASYGLIEEARKSFLDCEITFLEYCDLLDQHDVNVDLYTQNLERNLRRFRLM